MLIANCQTLAARRTAPRDICESAVVKILAFGNRSGSPSGNQKSERAYLFTSDGARTVPSRREGQKKTPAPGSARRECSRTVRPGNGGTQGYRQSAHEFDVASSRFEYRSSNGPSGAVISRGRRPVRNSLRRVIHALLRMWRQGVLRASSTGSTTVTVVPVRPSLLAMATAPP
jgi:hypothetical protein